MDNLLDEYEEVVNEAVALLDDERNNEWIKRNEGYIDEFNKNKEFIRKAFKKNETMPSLGVYQSITKAKEANKRTVKFDLRYEGQNVATLFVRDEKNGGIVDSSALKKP